MAQRYQTRLLSTYSIDYPEGSKFVYWFSRVLSKLYEDLESDLNINYTSKSLKKLTDTFCCFKLDSFILLRKACFYILDEGFGCALIEGGIVEKRLLDEPDQLAFSDRGMYFRLSKLEKQFQT